MRASHRRRRGRPGALGRRVTVTGVDLVLRPQPTIYLMWALGDEKTRKVIEAAHERAIERVLAWIEDRVAVIRYGKDGIYKVRPPGGLVAARFRHYEARSGMPLLHDHLLLSVKAQRLDGTWGSVGSLSRVPFSLTMALVRPQGTTSPPPSIELNTFAIAVAGCSLLALLLSVGLLNRALKRHRLRAATFRSSRILP
ncbi:relaxase domain-containing protein [Streptomyces niveus]|uniref:relaxase domain-containing protein n=1 Tax=Streptomyces niveus TaxID=193462 RepID=UPI00367AE7F1